MEHLLHYFQEDCLHYVLKENHGFLFLSPYNNYYLDYSIFLYPYHNKFVSYLYLKHSHTIQIKQKPQYKPLKHREESLYNPRKHIQNQD